MTVHFQVLYAALGVAGAALRLWAMRVLARHFTFEVGIVKDHKYDFPFLVPVPNELLISQFSSFASCFIKISHSCMP